MFLALTIMTAHGLTPNPPNPPVTGRQIFFDDFTQSGFPSQWAGVVSFGDLSSISNITQSGGYLVSTIKSTLSPVFGLTVMGVIANQTEQAIESVQPPHAVFRQFTFRLQPFNLTGNAHVLTPINRTLIADLRFGIMDTPNAGIVPHGFWFNVLESDKVLSTINAAFPKTKTAVTFNINTPMAGAGTTFYNFIAGAAHGTQNGILYEPLTSQFDVNQVHIYTIQTLIDTNNEQNTYVRWQIDNNAWEQVYDNACACIQGLGDVFSMYPTLIQVYEIAGAYTGCPCIIGQSLGTSVDYVLVTDYAPSNLPSGQLLSSNINPPLKNQGIYQPGGFSLTQYVQFQANEIGQGNIYAGGLFLTGIFLLIITLGLGGVFWRMHLGLNMFGMIWNISALAFIYLMFYCGVIPLVIPVLVTIGAAAIMFGIFRSGPPSLGGEVAG